MATIEDLLSNPSFEEIDSKLYVQHPGVVGVPYNSEGLLEIAQEVDRLARHDKFGQPPAFYMQLGTSGDLVTSLTEATFADLSRRDASTLTAIAHTAAELLEQACDNVYQCLGVEGITNAEVTGTLVTGVEPDDKWRTGCGLVYGAEYLNFYQVVGGVHTLLANERVPVGRNGNAFSYGAVDENLQQTQIITDELPLMRAIAPYRGPNPSELAALAPGKPPTAAWAYIEGKISFL